MTYTLAFTPLAIEIAKRHHTVEEVEAAVRKDIDHLLSTGLKHVDRLMFSTVCLGSMFDDALPKFFVTPCRPGVLRVDLAEYEDGTEVDVGPFAGMKVQIPKPDDR